MRSVVRLIAFALAVLTGILALPAAASAAPIEFLEPPSRVGYDVSHPQCATDLPPVRAFAVVGVNGGLSTRANPCLAEQLTWAAGSSGSVEDQPATQLYLNTANPGSLLALVTTWPERGATPYGACDGTNSAACSWQYGWERARNSVVSFFAPAARAARMDSQPGRYTWWLDVETMNTWQSGSDEARGRNRATLEGMTAYLVSRDARVGIYSTGQQWSEIVGTVTRDSPLAGRDSWLAGSSSLAEAVTACSDPALVPRGEVALIQYVRNGLDHNHACRGS
jgi:hypothetical protein